MTAETPSTVKIADLLDVIEAFLTGPTVAGQDDVLEADRPLHWHIAKALHFASEQDDLDLRAIAFKLELEAVLHHPEVLTATARTLYERLLKVAPQFP